VDFPIAEFNKERWGNFLMMPFASCEERTFVMQLAGKVGAQCFNVADEELLALTGYQFATRVVGILEAAERAEKAELADHSQ